MRFCRLRTAIVLASMPMVAVTALLWVRGAGPSPGDEGESARASRRARLEIWNTPLDDGRCAITVASFGGTRARLVRAESDGTIHFAVLEAPSRPNPVDVLRQGDWLKIKFGVDTPTTTLGTFASKAAALSRAGKLCPPRLRCLPGRPGCDGHPALPNPMQMYGPLPAPAP